MWYRKPRLLLVGLLVIGFGFGVALATADLSRSVELPLFAGFGAGGGLVAYWFRRKLNASGQLDERTEQIELRANRAAYGSLIVALSVVMAVYLFTDLTPNIILVLAGIVLGGGWINELYIEWYRRKL
jgi:hypothetical protein